MNAGISQGGVEPFVPQELLDGGDPAARVEQLGRAGVVAARALTRLKVTPTLHRRAI